MQQLVAEILAGKEPADLVVLAIPFVAVPLLSVRMRLKLGKTDPAHFPRLKIYARSVASQLLLVVCVAVLWWTRGRPFSALGLDLPLTFEGEMGLVVAATSAVVLITYLLSVLPRLDGERRARFLERLSQSKIAPRTPREALAFAPVALSAGISEELVYRGFLFWFLTPGIGLTASVAASAVIFGAGHVYQGWRGMASTAGVGLLLGALYAVSGSLWWVMALHALIDLQYCVIGLFVARWNRGTASGGG